MQTRFLLGPAGSGKTFRCLEEIRAALAVAPEGKPLIFLAPKQATFQLERQLLADAQLNGYTRLQILSFERLAQFVLDSFGVTAPKFLSDEGRVMVLRALLMRHADELKLFRQSARRPGFAQELGRLLNELQQHQFTPAKLRALAQRENLRNELQDKLHDLALLLEAYANWLAEHELQDGNHLLDAAIASLRDQFKIQNSKFKIESLWLDGFAEMTPQELDLLAAVIPACERATLAFCLDASAEASEPKKSWLSIWSSVGKTVQQCRQRIENLPDCEIQIETLERHFGKTRFAQNPVLRHLEQNWTQPKLNSESRIPNPEKAIRLIANSNAEIEAIFAAREILDFVRQGNRFRDCAVLVRNLDDYHKPLARAFHRYEIPFFLDRRESMAHHPLAELTRNAIRTVAFDWPQDDWFAALKTGFSPVEETEIDRLENESLARGWRGKKWREPIQIAENLELEKSLEQLRQKILPPFENFAKQLARHKNAPNGKQLAGALRQLWGDLKAEKKLQDWSDETVHDSQPAIHHTVWEQMNAWLESIELAFSRENLSLRDWLPILESGLANLTVGVIPPALDQVLIGAIDRARNPDLKLAFVLGANEGIFPATPNPSTILTDADREELGQTVSFGPNLREQLARERFYGYIACTRAGEKLFVTFSRQDADGKILNPSPFIAHLQHIFPQLQVEEFPDQFDLAQMQHINEIVPLIFAEQNSESANSSKLLQIPVIADLQKKLGVLREPDSNETLSPALAEKLFGPILQTSVSRLEEFAQCPFKFFVKSGLRAAERKTFELEARERGIFQHDVLKKFHEELTNENKRWRDITPAEARERIGKIAAEVAQSYRDGLLHDTAQTLFEAHTLTTALQDFIEVAVAWMRSQYEFDPAAVELNFGGKEDAQAPAWEIDLSGGHKLALEGRIDRVDLWRNPNGADALAVVMDYKSSSKKLDKILIEHGVQLQLPGYLAALRQLKNPQEIFRVERLIPAGVFYVNLRGEYKSGGTRDEILAEAADARKRAYRHSGRFDADVLSRLDRAEAKDQFNYRLTKEGKPYANSAEVMSRAEFEKLLDGVEIQIRKLGERIFSGAMEVSPYRKGKQTPCEYCDYQAACRIDKWTHQYRVLRAASAENVEADS
ncbi:MAG: PD-(D/E)XK nuclease family protein [Limisphaerales bacterium]